MTTKLTPQKAFEHASKLFMNVVAIRKDALHRYALRCVRNDSIEFEIVSVADIDWGDLTQYPPPEKKWRPATKEDAPKPIVARVRDNENSEWRQVQLLTFLENDFRPWMDANGSVWKHCEVPE